MAHKLVSFEIAKRAKQKDFDLDCSHHYTLKGVLVKGNVCNNFNHDCINVFPAPPQELLKDWLLDQHGEFVNCKHHTIFKKGSEKITWSNNIDKKRRTYKSYERALNEGLRKALMRVKC